MMNESTRKQDVHETFDLREWLTNDVKLPQYLDAFIENGFESPVECSSINEEDLATLGVLKIGHRKRLLQWCEKLANKWGLSSQDLPKPEKFPDIPTETEAKEQQSLPHNVQTPDNIGLPPVLPPKKGKKSRPALPPRNMAEQEVNTNSAEDDKSNVFVENPSDSSLEIRPNLTNVLQSEQLKPDKNTSEGGDSDTISESTNTAAIDLTRGDGISGYEPIWEAKEGEPLPLSPDKVTEKAQNNETKPANNTANLDTNKSYNSDNEQNKHINGEARQPDGNITAFSPPPIPPRADLEDGVEEVNHYVNVTSTNVANTVPETSGPSPVLSENKPVDLSPKEPNVTIKKKIPPAKPPRRSKLPVSMHIPPSVPLAYIPEPRRSVGSIDDTRLKPENEHEVCAKPSQELTDKPQTSEEKRSVFDRVPTTDMHEDSNVNIYGNVESLKDLSTQSTVPKTDTLTSEKNKKPKPAPRTINLSEKQRMDNENVKDTNKDIGIDGGSCTEDDLSGSEEEMPEEKSTDISSQYETVNFQPRTQSMAQARHSSKEGYLYKQGGQQNNKGWKKRWVVFDGNELRYYKDKEHTNESLQMVPIAIMKEVRIVTEDTKRARFDLACAGRTYMFALGMEDMDIITVWAQILMNAIIQVRKEDETNVTQAPGGDMFSPDKEGFIKKQGNNVVADWKKRYVAVKDGKFAYYHNYEDFILASPINTIQMNISTVKVDPKSPNRFQLVTPHRTYLFQCEEEMEVQSWIASLETAIQLALGDRTVINEIWKNPSNRRCADCGDKDPLWASVNLVVCVCARCIGAHRNLGVHASKPRSLLMDQKIWSPCLIKLMVEVGNENSNKFWEYRIPEDDKICPESSSEARQEFIHTKYVQRMYRHVSPLYGDPVALGEALKLAVCTNDVEKTMQLVFCGADIRYVSSHGSDIRTPYQLAEEAKQELQMEFLMQNGATTFDHEPRTPDPLTPDVDSAYETISDLISPSVYETPSFIPIAYEKEGYLLKKAPSAAVWRKRYFMLKGRELWYDKGDKEGHALIKLKDVDEYIYNDSIALDIVTAERTYNLKADTKEEALGWYIALRNKQVFEVPLECQELGSDGIPHLVAKSIQFVETHGLEVEGIYRKNGNMAKIKMLKKLFNQDPESVIILREEYEAHDVAGLLKLYFRTLPDPLMTEANYPVFITASFQPVHEDKLQMYKDCLGRLPEVNRTTLKAVINHLKRVTTKSQQNKMKLENMTIIFGPTLMTNQQMGAMNTNTMNHEYTVISDFITYYQWLFDVGDDELQKDKKMMEAIEKMKELDSQLASKDKPRVCEDMRLDIYHLTSEKECSQINVNKNTKASKICQELANKRAFAPELNWALYQNVNQQLDRPFPATEKVLDVVIETGKYSQLNKDSHLVVKRNYVQQKLQAYALQNDTSVSIAGQYQTMKEVKRKDSWKKLFVKLENGMLTVHKNAKSKDDIDSWPLYETTLYIGVDSDKKPLTNYGFTLVRIAKDGHCVYRYICFENEREQYRWINVFLKTKYRETEDLWTDADLEPIGYYAEAFVPVQSTPVPRQRTPSNKSSGSVSTDVLNELKQKQLRRSIKK